MVRRKATIKTWREHDPHELGVPVVGHLAPLLLLLVPVGGGPGVLCLPGPGGRGRVGGGVRGPGAVTGALVTACPALALVSPDVGQAGPRAGGGLGSKQLPRLLGVALLQVVPLVGLVVLEAGRLLPLLLEEGLELQLLFLLELPAVIVLQFLQSLLLLFMDDLKVNFL